MKTYLLLDFSDTEGLPHILFKYEVINSWWAGLVPTSLVPALTGITTNYYKRKVCRKYAKYHDYHRKLKKHEEEKANTV